MNVSCEASDPYLFERYEIIQPVLAAERLTEPVIDNAKRTFASEGYFVLQDIVSLLEWNYFRRRSRSNSRPIVCVR